MIGRLLGAAAGIAVALFGYGLWKPAAFAKYVDLAHFDLGPFGLYRTLVAGLIMAVGVAVVVAALQRRTTRAKARPVATLFSGAEEAPASPPAHDTHDTHAPAAHHEAAAHDDHGHDDHGHADHGHDAHAHDDLGHDDHAHAPDHGHEPAHAHH